MKFKISFGKIEVQLKLKNYLRKTKESNRWKNIFRQKRKFLKFNLPWKGVLSETFTEL